MRDRILGVAFEAFTKNGYADTATLEIARRAKSSKRGIYGNFGSKQGVDFRRHLQQLPEDLFSRSGHLFGFGMLRLLSAGSGAGPANAVQGVDQR